MIGDWARSSDKPGQARKTRDRGDGPEEILRESIVEEPVACANHRPAFTRHVPSNANARRKILVVRFVEAVQSGRSYLRQRARTVSLTGSKLLTRKFANRLFFSLDDPEVVPAQAVVHRQTRRSNGSYPGNRNRAYSPNVCRRSSLLSIEAVCKVAGEKI